MTGSLPPTLRYKTPHQGVTPSLKLLTRTQREVVRAIAQTGDYKAAAQMLGCAVKTIENHVVRIHKTLGVSSTVRVVLLAERAGLLEGVV